MPDFEFLDGIKTDSLPDEDTVADAEIDHLRTLATAAELARLQPALRASTPAYAAHENLGRPTDSWAGQPNS